MEEYIVTITVLGLAALGMAWMPALTRLIKISYSILYVAAGFLIYQFSDIPLPDPDPLAENSITLRLSEMVVIVSLMGTGLKIDEPFSFRSWRIPLRLVSITMIASILITSLLGYAWLGFPIATALLLGASLAPTDPVLASDVQVGPPLEETKSQARFSLSAEGGLNDGMAFPFTWLAIALASQAFSFPMLLEWALDDLLLKIVIGTAAGFLLGKGLAYAVFSLPAKAKLSEPNDGFVAISATLLVYGITELIHGYGFIAVFVCAITIRNYEIGHDYHRKLHSFTDQVERVLVAIVLILFGGSLARGILGDLHITTILFVITLIFIVRPVCTYLSLFRYKLPANEKALICFFGIKGVGSIFYISFAIAQAKFTGIKELWSVASLVILLSILVHGLSASKIFEKVEGAISKKPNKNGQSH